MNLDNNPTMDELRELLGACDDRAGHHVLWADRTGEVHITPILGHVSDFIRSRPDLQMWLRVFAAGENFVGPSAAEDIGWVEDLFIALTRNWPKAVARAGVVAVEDW